jgi:large subunit ribosomal protein L17
LISLVKNLLIYESIKTTKVRAFAARPIVERLISKAKANTLTAKRQAYRILSNHGLVKLLFNDIAPRFNDRVGGYTRILNLGSRRGDNAQLVILELTEIKKEEPRRPKKEKEAKAEEEKKPEVMKEKPVEEKKTKVQAEVKEKPPIIKKPSKKFLGGLRNIFKKERDSL